MPEPFLDSPDSERFRRAYDAVLARWPTTREELRVETDLGVTVVHALGPDDGPPVVLMHGGGATAAQWFANVGVWSQSLRVYAPDRPGEAGLSRPGPDRPRRATDWNRWLAQTITGLGVQQASLVGHSYGGWLALRFTLDHPDRVSRLALIDPSLCFRGGRSEYNVRGAPVFLRPSAKRMRSFMAWETRGRALTEDFVHLLAVGAQDYPEAKVVLPRRPEHEELRGLRVPTLLVLPLQSRQNDPRRTAEDARARLSDVTVVELADQTHHTVPTERAGELNARVLDFLARWHGYGGRADSAG